VIILGVDPGTGVTGYGVIRSVGGSHSLIECGVIRTSPTEPLHTRLHEIHEGITELIARHQPQALAVEDVFYSRNVRTTVVLGHARGVVLMAGAHAGLEVAEYPPAEIKKAVAGTGAATKPQVQFMVTQLLRLKSPPEPADASDGVAVALTHAMSAHLRRIADVARAPVTRVPLTR
jgi:crossover junction endodeoxyribonuclease RuvC